MGNLSGLYIIVLVCIACVYVCVGVGVCVCGRGVEYKYRDSMSIFLIVIVNSFPAWLIFTSDGSVAQLACLMAHIAQYASLPVSISETLLA